MSPEESQPEFRQPPARRKQTAVNSLMSFLGILAAISLVFTAWLYRGQDLRAKPQITATPAPIIPTPTEFVELPPYDAALIGVTGLNRQAQLHTTLPDFSGYEIKQYEVQKNDTLFGIAEKFGIKPQTILWGNYDVLFDNPDRLSVGADLRILPADGLLYTWTKDDGLNGVADFFKVAPEDIISWPGNHLDSDTIGDYAHPNIAVGTTLFVPGGKRDFVSASVPVISRSNPASASVVGPGSCGSISTGATGGGTFVWPTTMHEISGYGYDPSINHSGIDIGGQIGNAVYATDAGVVVYAGWNDWGYGNLIVIDHGNGWQSLYAHLSAILVGCGASVNQGGQIGTIGVTGNSTGPHLHFELSINGVKVNPLGYTQ